MNEITAQIKQAVRFYPGLRRIFLADGNALVLDNDKLLSILAMLKESFPKLSRVGCYAGPRDILRKSPEELAKLKNAGLQIVYLGIESGDDEVLTAVNKGVSADEMVIAGNRILSAGLKLSAMVILGLGGKEKSRQHAIHTAQVVNKINPTMLSALTLMLHEGTPLRDAAEKGLFTPLSPYDYALELKQIIENIELSKPCIFRSNHVSNFLPLAGTLPQDKKQLLATIDYMLSHLIGNNKPTFNDNGDF